MRSDSAAYEPEGVLDPWQRQGWEFAVSADMTPQLRETITALPEEAWQPWKQEGDGKLREWAEVPYVPGRVHEKKDAPLYRVRPRQGSLFSDGAVVRHFAVVTNRWEMEGQALLDWQRGKQGTIEHIHHVLKNELGAGVYPSGKHGANAAWLRLQVVTHNLLTLLKAVALPPEYRAARPKRLRFAVFTQIGQVVRHAGMTLVRVMQQDWEDLLRPGQRRVLVADWGSG